MILANIKLVFKVWKKNVRGILVVSCNYKRVIILASVNCGCTEKKFSTHFKDGVSFNTLNLYKFCYFSHA